MDHTTHGGGENKGTAIHGGDPREAYSFTAGPPLRCIDFGWIATWASTASSPYGGRATANYLKDHPEESNNVHVVMLMSM